MHKTYKSCVQVHWMVFRVVTSYLYVNYYYFYIRVRSVVDGSVQKIALLSSACLVHVYLQYIGERFMKYYSCCSFSSLYMWCGCVDINT
jgi:hypothetical protein